MTSCSRVYDWLEACACASSLDLVAYTPSERLDIATKGMYRTTGSASRKELLRAYFAAVWHLQVATIACSSSCTKFTMQVCQTNMCFAADFWI